MQATHQILLPRGSSHIPSPKKVHTRDFRQKNHAIFHSILLQVNWDDLDVMSDAGINWADITVMSEAGVNWADIDVFSKAGIKTACRKNFPNLFKISSENF